MCQYYRWQCSKCSAMNDVVVRCLSFSGHQSNPPCPRTAEPLPLPHDAPNLDCQQCFASRPPTSRPDHYSREHNLNASFRRMSIQTPAVPPNQALYVPPDHDLFWMSPALRLPDPAEKLGEYGKKRDEVFAMAESAPSLLGCADQKAGDGGNGNSAWEAAWLQLKDALQKA